MRPFFKIMPQSVAQLGINTQYDKSISPWRIVKLHVVFDVFSDDDMLRTSPCYFVTERLCEALTATDLTGIAIGEKVETEPFATFRNLYPQKIIPVYYLLNVTGKAYHDDFGIHDSNGLILSAEAFKLVRSYTCVDLKFESGNT